jgi:hypothetical protein
MAFHLKAALALGLLFAPAPVFAQPIGSAEPVTRAPEDEQNLQYAASVARVTPLSHQGDLGGTIFSTVGGDPAMNGEYVFLAFDISPAEGARIFKIGDVLDYRIVSETPGRVLLAVRENVMNDNGEIGEGSRHVAVTWTPGPDGTPPANVTVAPAP